jgi:peroxiredoxin
MIRLIQKKDIQKAAIQTIPAFSLPDVNGQQFTERSLQKHTPTLFLFFDPECENCKEEFKQINIYRDSFPDCQMVFVSTLPENMILDFLERIDFQPSANMFFLRDIKAELMQTIDVKGVPSALIYDKNGKLIKNYAGQVKIETLIKYLSD